MVQVRWNKSSPNSKRVVIFRHGERVDVVFGFPSSWMDNSFDENGKYNKTNLNMPNSLPKRPLEQWVNDGPLTKLGEYQSQLVGEELKKTEIKFTKVFVSPAYRCLKTAQGILSAMGIEDNLPMKVEYGLYEFLGFTKRFQLPFPNFMSIDEMSKLYNIDSDYKPKMTYDQLRETSEESMENHFDRNSSVMREILNESEGDILVVAHGSTIDTCTRQLLGKPPRSFEETKKLLAEVPYLVSSAMEIIDNKIFKLIDPPCLPLTHKNCPQFDWRSLDDEE